MVGIVSALLIIDKITSKSREADIIAKKEFLISGYKDVENFSKEKKILIKFFISCKFIKDEVVFGFGEKNSIKVKELIKEQLSLSKEDLERNELVLQFHHYNKEKNVAKKNNQKGQIDAVYKAWNESINSFLYSPLEDDEYKYKKVYKFPIVIVNNFDNFHKKDYNPKDECLKIENNFQFEIFYAIPINDHSVRKYFLVDFIGLDKLENFLKENFEEKENEETEDNNISLIKKILNQKIREESFCKRRNSIVKRSALDPYW